MSSRFTVAACGVLLSLVLLGASEGACVGGHIPPSMFQFKNIVPYRGNGTETGGWKVAQVVILLSRISPEFPESATCDIEVGVPERNKLGWVLDEFAQAEAAKAADEAARIVLREHLPTALACIQFRKHMQGILTNIDGGPIPGARVSAFNEAGVQRTTFP